jgi:hypothetical protein
MATLKLIDFGLSTFFIDGTRFFSSSFYLVDVLEAILVVYLMFE